MPSSAERVPPDILLQHHLQGPDDEFRAWRILVATLLLKMTRWVTAQPTAEEILERWPEPTLLAEADPTELTAVLERVGMQHRRCRELQEMSRRYAYWLDDRIGDAPGPAPGVVATWPGCGPYVSDAVRLLIHEDFDGPPPGDEKLRRYYLRRKGAMGRPDGEGEGPVGDSGSTPDASIP